MTVEVQPSELRARLAAGDPVFVIDVREPEEVAAQAFPGAHHIPLGDLGDRTGELPPDASIVVVCHAGVRSAVAAAALTRAGWPAESLAGGIVAWSESHPGRVQ
jgi:sulfur-carrier protein adenylyltransferase/sulfurtransferase